MKLKIALMIVFSVLFVITNAQKPEKAEKVGDVFLIVEEMPEFPGGEQALREFIAKSVKYPEEAQKAGTQGKVYITFVVDTDGSVIDAKVARGVVPSLDNEALRVVNMLPKWKPGKQKGQAVKVSYTVPINFALECSKEKTEKVEKVGDVFLIVEEMPEFPGGEEALREFMAKTIKYPEDAKKGGIEGKVYITFVVDTDGGVIDAKVARGVAPSLDNEALRVINLLPKWKPGKQKGQAVKVAYTVPVQFKLK